MAKQYFNAFKIEFLRYYSNNNSINWLENTFTIIKQEETKAVTTYLEHFHRNLHQIQAIDTNYFTAAQILNQFIRGLHNSILQCVCPMHPADLQAAVTNARNFEAAKLEANHAQAVNLAINRLSELDSKLKQFSNSINQKLEEYLADNYTIYQPPQQYNNLGTTNCPQNQNLLSKLSTSDTATNLSTTCISISNLSTAASSNISTAATSNLSTSTNSNSATKFGSETRYIQNPSSQNYLSFLVIPEDILFDNMKTNQIQPLISNILPAASTEDKLLAAIFSFDLNEIIPVPLFSRAILDTKLITAIYTNTKVDGQPIKLIFDSYQVDHAASARIIIANRATKTPIGEIDNFFFEVNGITISIKVLNSQHTYVPAMCGHFKTTIMPALLIELKEKKNLPEKHIKFCGLTMSITNYHQTNYQQPENRKNNTKGKEKEKKKIQHQILLTIYILTYYHNQTIIDQSLYVVIAARNCHQWAHTIKECRTTFLDEEKHAMNCMLLRDKQLNTWMDVYMIMTKFELDWDPEPHPLERNKSNGWKKSTLDYCNLIYNPPPRIIYTIPEENEPISCCALELGSTFNLDSNSNNDDDKNNDSSFAQNGNENINNSNSDSNPKIYIELSDLTKEQVLK
ncbi:hypothetical protein G9A89_002154 [Geosiphon pyriformis]|nr:hypothetical protein G9A89_002154 [Geosiphon pyriformis]